MEETVEVGLLLEPLVLAFLHPFPKFPEFGGLALPVHHRLALPVHHPAWVPAHCRGHPALDTHSRPEATGRPELSPSPVNQVLFFSCLVHDGLRLLLPDSLACGHQPHNWQITFQPLWKGVVPRNELLIATPDRNATTKAQKASEWHTKACKSGTEV